MLTTVRLHTGLPFAPPVHNLVYSLSLGRTVVRWRGVVRITVRIRMQSS